MGRPRKTRITYLSGRKKPHRVTFWESEKQKTQHFSKKIDAELFAREHGWESLDPSLAVSAEERILIGKLRGGANTLGCSIEDIINAGIKSIRDLNSNVPNLEDAVSEYIDESDLNGARDATLVNENRFLGFLIKAEGRETPVNLISPSAAQRIVRKHYRNPNSARTYMAQLTAFFRWCAEPSKNWAQKEWLQRQRLRTKKEDKSAPAIVEPEQARNFMLAVPIQHRAGFAVQWLAGLRPEEVIPRRDGDARLEWSDIDLDGKTINIRGEVSKIRIPRLIHNCFNELWHWLEDTPENERNGPVLKMNYRNFRKLRRAAGDRAGIERPWPRDLMRDSFATYSFHYFGLETTINNTGHMNEPRTFFAHYKGVTIKEKADAYANALKFTNEDNSSGIWYEMGTK